MTTEVQFSEEHEPQTAPSSDLSSAPLRTQLLWSSFFPLALFGLLATLAITFTIARITLNLTAQRNTAEIALVSNEIENELSAGKAPAQLDWVSLTRSSDSGKYSDFYLVSGSDNSIFTSSLANSDSRLNPSAIIDLARHPQKSGSIYQSPLTQEQVLVTIKPIPEYGLTLVWAEPWQQILAPTVAYQVLLIVLIFLGVFLSLVMLSLAISRIIRSITELTENASRAVPGSIFRPLKEAGPREIRLLIRSFNQMVIRLARQQTSLRQYAHKALLSQEEERQRISRELHDGTLQDLVGLYQRVELCSNELANNPSLARERLDEIHRLLDQSIDDVRSISIALRPPLLEDLGLVVAIESLCKELTQARPELNCTFSLSGTSRRLSADMELAIYRVIQEALNNIRKHVPDATCVEVQLAFAANEIKAQIGNNGRAFTDQDVQGFVKSGHIGLAGMYERARLFGGSLKIKSTAGENTLITLRLPCELEKQIPETTQN